MYEEIYKNIRLLGARKHQHYQPYEDVCKGHSVLRYLAYRIKVKWLKGVRKTLRLSPTYDKIVP